MGIAGIESREQQGTPNGHKQAKGTLVPQHFDPHVMAIDTDRRNWNKKINPHLIRSTGIDRGEKRR
jgi:hypothetical protein